MTTQAKIDAVAEIAESLRGAQSVEERVEVLG